LWLSEQQPTHNWVGQHKALTGVAASVSLLIVLGIVGAIAGPQDQAASKPVANSADTTATSDSTLAATPTVAPTTEAPPTPSRQPVPQAKTTHHAARTVAHSANSWTMPNLRGRDLQTAQDAIQSLTNDSVWFTDSHDASGQGRGQWLDRDWQVCDQSVAPGATITADTKIDFGVVRRFSESCP